MKRTWKIFAGLTVAAVLMVLLMGTALASGTFNVSDAAASGPSLEESVAGGCTKMKADEVGFFTVTEEGDIDEIVESLPSGATEIHAGFTYNCVPKSTVIVTVWDLDGETIFSGKESLKPSTADSAYVAGLQNKDGSELPDGEYSVSFYNNKTLLTSGTIVIGGEGADSEGGTVSIEGAITDKRTGRPIVGATIIVLSPSTTIREWVDNDMPADDIFASAETDADGEFAFDEPLERNVAYPFIVGADGYQLILEEEVMFDDEAPDPVVLGIQMTKSK